MSNLTITPRGSLTPEFKAEWTAALRSGNYQQGKSRLTRKYIAVDGTVTEKDCCLGVACKLHPLDAIRTEGGIEAIEPQFDMNSILDGEFQAVFYNGMSGMPTEAFNLKYFGGGEPPAFSIDWTDVVTDYDDLPVEVSRHDFETFASLNDEGLTFSQIADLIDYLY